MMKSLRRRRGRHECRRVVLHHADGEPEARLWASACRSVLKELGIASSWRVDVDQARDGFLIAVDYQPATSAHARGAP
jgi:hypothetical protein